MLLAVPKYGRVKVNKVLSPVPDLAEQDDRRPLAAPAHRARLACCAGSAAPACRGLRHHRPLRGRQGHADPHAARARARARAVRVGDHARAAAGRGATASTTTSSTTTEFERARRTPATSSSTPRYSGRRYGTLRSELEQRLARGRARSCSRSRSRARARSARRCPRRSQVFIAPPSRGRAARRGSSAAAPTTPEEVERRLATAREELRGAGRVRATSSSTTGSRTRWQSWRLWSGGS